MIYPVWIRALGSAVALVVITGCSRQLPVEEARSNNTLLIANGPEPSSLDPHLCGGKAEGLIIAALWEPLTAWNEDGTEIIPAAAASWNISADGLTYTFHLRPDAKWSNGDPVTAHDWVRSFRRWLTPSLGADLAYFADSIIGVPEFRNGKNTDVESLGIRAPDDHTLVIVHQHPRISFLTDITFFPWLPVHMPSLREAGDPFSPTTDFIRPGKLITNGPFKLTDWKIDQYVEVSRNPHFRTTPRLEGIRFMAMNDAGTMERAYRAGQLHVTKSIPPNKVSVYAEASDPALTSYQIAGTQYLTFNTLRAPFDQVKVRQALSLALDRQQIADVILRDGSAPAFTFAAAMSGGYQPRHQIVESVETAQKLLTDAGYPNGEGLPELELLFFISDQNSALAQAIQQMWQATLGVTVTLRNEEWKVYLDTEENRRHHVMLNGWLPLSAEPIELLQLLTQDATSNSTGWSNTEFDTLLDQALHTMNQTERYELYHQMDAIIRDQMPLVPISYRTSNRLVHPAVEGWPANMVEGMVWTRVGFKN